MTTTRTTRRRRTYYTAALGVMLVGLIAAPLLEPGMHEAAALGQTQAVAAPAPRPSTVSTTSPRTAAVPGSADDADSGHTGRSEPSAGAGDAAAAHEGETTSGAGPETSDETATSEGAAGGADSTSVGEAPLDDAGTGSAAAPSADAERPGPDARVEAAGVTPFATIPTPGGVSASMRHHQGYTGKNGNAHNAQHNYIRYGHAANSVTSGTVQNQGGFAGTGSPLWYSNGYSAKVATGSTAYSAHGHAIQNPGLDLDLRRQSALGFAPADVRSVQTGLIFNLGRMVHRNNPVQIVDEWYQGDLEISFLGMALDYRWRLYETPNKRPQPSHPDNDDFVDFVTQVGDQTFVHNGLLHTLVVHGFTQPDAQSSCAPTLDDFSRVKNEFRTTEGQSTYGCLYASVEQVRNLTVEKVVETPFGEPTQRDRFPFAATSSLEGSGWLTPANTRFSLAGGERRTAPYNTGERLTFTEGPLPDDWRLRDITCVDGRGDVLAGVHTSVARGELVVPQSITADNAVSAPITCTFTNVYEPHARLSLEKRVVSTGQLEPVARPEHWTLRAELVGGGDEHTLTGTSGVSKELPAGTYLLSETANTAATTQGYTQTGEWQCRDGRGAVLPVTDSTVTLSRNQSVTCTATNTYHSGALGVRKAFAETVPEGAGRIDFTGDYECEISGTPVAAGTWSSHGAEQAQLTAAAGTPDPRTLPVGAMCSATEHDLPEPGEPGLPNASWRWGAPAVSDPVTITHGVEAELIITNTAEHEVGTVTWLKQGETSAALSGSSWELLGPPAFADEFGLSPGEALAVTDCEGAPCAGPDRDPRAGRFRIEGLPAGDYELRETAAPAGYELLSDPILFSVGSGGAGFDIALAPVINRPLSGPAIPLTGGFGRDHFAIAGLAVLGGGGAGLLADAARRRYQHPRRT